ncbi:HAMP domain-containing sensor histidine kinase [Neorhizobium sp. Rsf11]|uniref:histidine kinase n=3 Tax=Rhizobium/Agrobacterium group TaxID=227290 RepID=A0ABV0M952_9HYPH|nr:HAMP domain-containing sensor histidine kinase [Neorhizobium petrolearium]MCC2609007.1 HAMP domain-containing histidine kinase [Neorhizobium petrolearium]WGI69248.1 HAMP domain-containing sensor histidine kinase [Neorhizobium petrolearium]
MRVLSNIADRMVLLVDETVNRWLTRLSEGEVARAEEIALFRRLVFACLATLVVVPSALTLVFTPALALPVGAALVISFFLLAVAALFALPRHAVVSAVVPQPEEIAFEACPGLSLILDPQGQVMKTGGRDRDAFPVGLSEASGLPLAECVHVSDRIGLVQALDVLRQGAASAVVDIRIERPLSAAGRQFLPVRLDMTAIRDGEGQFVHAFAQARDMSEEEDLRAEAVARVAEARSAHEAKSRFLAAVSHELRTPLNAILGFSDVLAGEYFGRLENDRQREYVGLIRQSGAHLLSVVNTMLDMSKIEAGRYELIAEPFALAEAMEACRAMLDLSAREKGVTLASRASRGLGEVIADRRAVQQILINLASNAIKFTEAGGAVSIDAVLAGDDVVISVSDTGIGIAAEKLEFIGQPFMQVENAYTRSYEGTGLGLSLVKGLVALHGGRFSIASRAGEGTVVTVSLPADGSGIGSKRDQTREEKVEFPPRLSKARLTPQKTFMMDEQDFIDGRAEAKIA